jgi:predicted MPP superfamily phosphohydrolase
MPLFFLFLFLFIFCLATYTTGVALLGFNPKGLWRRFLIGLGIFSPFSFILANIWFRYYPNIFSQIFYTFFSYLGGFFIYWFLASIFVGIFYLISKFKNLPIFRISLFFYSIFSIVALIGIVQAFFIKVTSYEIKAPVVYRDLPNTRIVLVSDTHFGPVAQERFAKRVVNKILEQKPDLVFIAGDMFDGPEFDKRLLEAEIKILTKAVPVFFVPGNHESYGDYAEFLKSSERMGMINLVDGQSEYQGALIFGLDYRANKKSQEAEDLIRNNINKKRPAIVIIHEPSHQETLKDNGAFLVLFAHTHNGQFWPGNFLARWVYGEYTYGLVKKGETTFVTTKGVGTAGPRFRTFNSPEIVVLDLK